MLFILIKSIIHSNKVRIINQEWSRVRPLKNNLKFIYSMEYFYNFLSTKWLIKLLCIVVAWLYTVQIVWLSVSLLHVDGLHISGWQGNSFTRPNHSTRQVGNSSNGKFTLSDGYLENSKDFVCTILLGCRSCCSYWQNSYSIGSLLGNIDVRLPKRECKLNIDHFGGS